MTLLAPLPKSIATVSLSGTLPEKLEAAAAIGFDGVEIFENDLLTYDGSPEDVRAIAEGLGLAITIFQPFRDFEAMPEPQRAPKPRPRRAQIRRHAGARHRPVLVCSNVHPGAIDDPQRAAADLRGDGGAGPNAAACASATRRWPGAAMSIDGARPGRSSQTADHPALGLIVDSFHTLALGDDPSGIAALPADKLFFVQLADAPELSMDVLSWSRHFRNFPGQGQLPVAAIPARRAGLRLSRPAVAGDLQRRVPRRAGTADRARRPALAAPGGSRGGRRRTAPTATIQRRGIPRIRRGRGNRPPAWRNPAQPRIPSRRPPPFQVGGTVPPGSAST